MENDGIEIEVAYGNLTGYHCLQLRLQASCTLRQAIEQSGITQLYPEIAEQQLADQLVVGIFGEIKSLDDLVESGDRVEIYRPIQVDPMQDRFARVKSQRKVLVKKRHQPAKRQS